MDPAEKWEKVLVLDSLKSIIVVGGTCGILWSDSVKFFTLGSVSRGILSREWRISFEHFEALRFTFCPQADVMAVVEAMARP